jgi:PiT family inorganic phosphate transporter
MMASSDAFVIGVIFLAFFFDFINGFHDAGNAIATLVTTRVMTPRQAVLWAAFFNFIAVFIFKLSVANTIGQGLIDVQFVSVDLIF